MKPIRWLLCGLVTVLMLEGVIRKLLPGVLSNLFIFFKDGLIIVMLVLVMGRGMKGYARNLFTMYIIFVVAFIPSILFTALKDPVLAIFGAKQYLLYPFVALALCAAFPDAKDPRFIRVHKIIACFLIPTTLLAVIQIKLPSSHWLNLSVKGTDLSGFGIGGKLRVSSTFAFVAQYCWYLMTVTYALAIAYVWRKKKGWEKKVFNPYIILIFYVIGTFITGSRLAVLGNGIILTIAGFLIVVKGKKRNMSTLFGLLFAGFIAFNVAQKIFPDAFVVYDIRSQGMANRSQTSEIARRLEHATFGWLYLPKKSENFVFGYGIGTMSNGVENLSKYAAKIRGQGIWGEADVVNTVLEGGYYLVFIWMSFRFLVIVYCFQIYVSLRNSNCIYACAFVMGYLIFNGVTATIGVQPPIAIWWWLSVGTVLMVGRYDKILHAIAIQERKEAELKIV